MESRLDLGRGRVPRRRPCASLDYGQMMGKRREQCVVKMCRKDSSPALGCSAGPVLSLKTGPGAAFLEQCDERQNTRCSQGWVKIHTLESVSSYVDGNWKNFWMTLEKPENRLGNT